MQKKSDIRNFSFSLKLCVTINYLISILIYYNIKSSITKNKYINPIILLNKIKKNKITKTHPHSHPQTPKLYPTNKTATNSKHLC